MILGYRSYRQIFLVYGFILVASAVAFWVRSTKFQSFSPSLNASITIASIILGSFFWELLRMANTLLNKYMPFEDGIAPRVAVQLLIGVVAGMLVRFVIYYFGEPFLPFKLDEMFIATTWVIYAFLPVSVNLVFFAIYFIDRWKYFLILSERLEKEKAQVQFDNLKNQLNPHFLFNALTSLNSLIFQDQALASAFLQQLSKVYRYVLQNKDKTMVSLDTELTFIQHYVSLLETRFKGSLTISFDIPDSARERAIVPVTLQILIENALKHNVVDKVKPLVISVAVKGDYLQVANNLQLKKLIENSNRVGLENLRTLYGFLSERPLQIERDNEEFIVRIPLL